jgi:hypothetical protein
MMALNTSICRRRMVASLMEKRWNDEHFNAVEYTQRL